jgi:2-amino-4-hydroxy-6-hydroxymethyldihydropteridine diphosphokinase
VHKAYIAIGSNLNQPINQVRQAILALEKLPQTKLVKQSSLYQSDPLGYENQPDFINAVAEISTALKPETLMQRLLKIEEKFGRERTFSNAPRIVDLDLLLYADVVMKTDFLSLPHPRMHTRCFVLLPLAEIEPNLIIPNRGNVVKLAAQNQDLSIKKLNHNKHV